MSTIRLSNTNNSACSAHRRHDSGELGVFEAVRYFAGAIDGVGLAGRIGPQNVMREDRVLWREERRSMDIPMTTIPPQGYQRVEKYHSKERKGKQPSSPGSRLASFLNSIFNQTASKKKSKSHTTTKSSKDGELGEKLGGRSCHSRSIRSGDSKSIYSSESSGVNTPLSHTNIPAKSQKEQCSSSKSHGQPKVAAFCPQREVWDERRIQGEDWLSEIAKLGGRKDKLYGKRKVLGGGKPDVAWKEGLMENRWVWNGNKEGFFENHGECGEEFRRKEESREDNGGESDSSSDLFELKNMDFGEFASGRPVHGTRDMEMVKNGSSITTVPF